jgi:asparagine N-glycosylation enzyme membrane subunit Stt3
MANSKAHFPVESQTVNGYFGRITYTNDSNAVYITGSVSPSWVTVNTGSSTTLGYRRFTLNDNTARILWAEGQSIVSGSNLSGSLRVLSVDASAGTIEVQEQVSATTDRAIKSNTGVVLYFASETP